MFTKLGITKSTGSSLIESLILHFPLPMFYKSSKDNTFITNEAFDDVAGSHKKKILDELAQIQVVHNTKFELKLINDIGKEMDTITYISEVDEGTLGVIVDITDQVKAKKSIHSLKERYEIATKGSHEGLWEWDIKTGEVFYSNKFKEIVGLQHKTVEPKIETWIARIDPRDKAKVVKALEAYLNNQSDTFVAEHRINIGGTIKWMSITGKASHDENHRPNKLTGFISEITQRKEAQLALKSSEEQFSLFMKNLPAGAFIKDEQGTFVFTNEYLNRFFGKESLVNLDYKEVFPQESLQSLQESDAKTLSCGTDTVEERLKDASGQEKYFQTHKFVINKDNKQYIGGIYSDITDQKRTQTKLNILAHYDLLTNLPNRMMFQDSLKNMISKANRNKSKIALMFIDLDNFKMINDTLGHDYGDLLLQEVAARLKKILRAEDVVSRLGGDEFTVILDDVKDTAYPSVVAQKIIDTLSQPIKLKDEMGYIGASIGISIFPDDTDGIEQLIKNADLAMYRSKHEGKNVYRYFTEDMNADASEKLELTNDLRSAIDHEQLEIHYQPIINTQTNKLASFEALVRWQHPKYGLITPNNFISLAEEGGFMVKVGKFVIKKVCNQIKMMQDAGLHAKIAINISSKQLTQNHLEQTVKSIVTESGINPSLLELEVTESFLMENIEAVEKVISNLKEFGISTAIDDFGTGYSSLARLKKLSISKLKIDKSFINDIPHDEDDMVITEMIITLAKQLHLEIVAEGVETEEQAAFLKAKGCHLMQGYLFSEAIPESDINNFIKNAS
jgi:diguanylate cyclase (GGDEF)-like protein/PAS domain S-box-containing protein